MSKYLRRTYLQHCTAITDDLRSRTGYAEKLLSYFNEIFSNKKSRISNLWLWRKIMEKSWNFAYIQATQCRTPFILMKFFTTKNHKNSRESLFMFKLHTTELLSFWRDFAQKIQNSIWRHLAVIFGTIGTKVDLPL